MPAGKTLYFPTTKGLESHMLFLLSFSEGSNKQRIFFHTQQPLINREVWYSNGPNMSSNQKVWFSNGLPNHVIRPFEN